MQIVAKHIFLTFLIIVVSAFAISTPAFAATSIKYGWMALDVNRNPVLQGSQYQLSGTVKPVAYITNGTLTVPVTADSVVYLCNTKVGTGQALVIGNKISGCKDAFVTHFTITSQTTANTKTSTTAASQAPKTIVPAKVSVSSPEVAISSIAPQYTDSLTAVKPSVTLKYKGKKLIYKTDYTLTYTDKKGNKVTPKKPGTYKAVIKGKGNYTGSKTIAFKLVNQGDDLARFACLISYSKLTIYEKSGKYATGRYMAALKTFRPNANSRIARGCDMVVCTASRISGYDKKMPGDLRSGSNDQRHYLGLVGSAKTTRWKKICKYTSGMEDKGKLQPGDIVVNNYHICMYVGHDIVMDVYNKYLKNKKDANLGKPKSKACWVSGSYHTSFGACICTHDDAIVTSGTVYRCVKPQKRVVFDTYAKSGKTTYLK